MACDVLASGAMSTAYITVLIFLIQVGECFFLCATLVWVEVSMHVLNCAVACSPSPHPTRPSEVEAGGTIAIG